MKRIANLFAVILILSSCTGYRSYFKAGERLEKQGLVNDAAEYYLEALKRKPSSVAARIKVRDCGQKYVSAMSSEFFRKFNTQDLDGSLVSYESMKAYVDKSSTFNIQLDYPTTYNDDYQRGVELYCQKNYNSGLVLVQQKKYNEALLYLNRVKKYKPDYRNVKQLDIVAVCEPLYQSAITSIEAKNYQQALTQLTAIRNKTDNYKDYNDLLELASQQQSKSFILFTPRASGNPEEQDIQNDLYTRFNQVALQKLQVKIINNTPFQNSPSAVDLNNSTNIDLIQAIRKATGADYFYVFDVSRINHSDPGIMRTSDRAFLEEKVRKNDSVTETRYREIDYNRVRAQRSLSYSFDYKIINAYNNQVVSASNQVLNAQDNVEYNEFQRTFRDNINNLYPANPQNSQPGALLFVRSWRNLFSARSTLKSFSDLRTETYNQAETTFVRTAGNMR